MKEGPVVFMKHLAQGSRGPAGVQRGETHLVDAVMGSGLGCEDGSWMGVISAANEGKHQHAMKAFQLLSPSTGS